MATTKQQMNESAVSVFLCCREDNDDDDAPIERDAVWKNGFHQYWRNVCWVS